MIDIEAIKLLQSIHPEWILHPLSSPKDSGNSPGKRPLLKGWQMLQKTPDYILDHIKRECNIGLVCGKASGVTVLDFDSDLFIPELFGGFDINTLKSKRTEGRKHVYFKYNPDLPSKKYHDLGIEILNDGCNAVIPPSAHYSGQAYKWNNPETPITEMPKKLEERLLKLFRTEDELKQIIARTRTCFRNILRKKPDMHGADGRQYMLAVCTDLRAAGAREEHFKLFARLIYGKDYDENKTLTEIRYIDSEKTWRCETLREKLFGYIDPDLCEKCSSKNQIKRNSYPAKDPKNSYFTNDNFVPKRLADEILTQYHFITLRDSDELYIYANGMYIPDGESIIKEETQRLLGDETRTKYVNEVVDYIKRATYVSREDINKHKDIINLENGLYNLQTGELMTHSPDQLSTVRIPVKYDPQAKCPNIERFFSEVLFESDIKLIHEMFGYCLIPDYAIQKAFMMLGDGQNGKSKMLTLLTAFLGKQNCSGQSLQNISDNRFAAAQLYGRLANIFPDLPDRKIVHDSMFKALVGGDRISAEHKHSHPFEFENTARLIFSANRLPAIDNEENYAYFRRWIIISFPNKFDGSKNDPRILDKLTTYEELSGLLNLAIEGLRRVLNNGRFSYDLTTEQISEQYVRLSNPIKAFLLDMCMREPEAQCIKDELYSAYTKYCTDRKLSAKAANIFSKELKRQNITEARPEIDGKRVRVWNGVRLKNKPDLDNEADGLEGIQESLDGYASDREDSSVQVCPSSGNEPGRSKIDNGGSQPSGCVQDVQVNFPILSNIYLPSARTHAEYNTLEKQPGHPRHNEEKSQSAELSPSSEGDHEVTWTCGICGGGLEEGEGVDGLPGLGMIHDACKYFPLELEIMQDVPVFMGIDLKPYGPFKQGDRVNIPAMNALPLIQKKTAIKRRDTDKVPSSCRDIIER